MSSTWESCFPLAARLTWAPAFASVRSEWSRIKDGTSARRELKAKESCDDV